MLCGFIKELETEMDAPLMVVNDGVKFSTVDFGNPTEGQCSEKLHLALFLVFTFINWRVLVVATFGVLVGVGKFRVLEEDLVWEPF